MDVAPITFGTVPIYEAYNYGVEVHKNPLNLTEDDYSKHLKIMQKMVLIIPQFIVESQKILQKEFLKVQRYGGVVSKGGTITAAWMLKYDKENPYLLIMII